MFNTFFQGKKEAPDEFGRHGKQLNVDQIKEILYFQSHKCYAGACDTTDNFGSTFHVTCNQLNNILTEKS